jgi:hypothetical protein
VYGRVISLRVLTIVIWLVRSRMGVKSLSRRLSDSNDFYPINNLDINAIPL